MKGQNRTCKALYFCTFRAWQITTTKNCGSQGFELQFRLNFLNIKGFLHTIQPNPESIRIVSPCIHWYPTVCRSTFRWKWWLFSNIKRHVCSKHVFLYITILKRETSRHMKKQSIHHKNRPLWLEAIKKCQQIPLVCVTSINQQHAI